MRHFGWVHGGSITAKAFAFSIVSFGGGPSLRADTEIVVTTAINPGRCGLIFSRQTLQQCGYFTHLP